MTLKKKIWYYILIALFIGIAAAPIYIDTNTAEANCCRSGDNFD